MGEIAEALRRAKDERARNREQQPDAPSRPEPRPEPDEGGPPHGLDLPWSDPEESPPAAPARPQPATEVLQISRDKTGTWPARAVWVDGRGGSAEVYRHFAIRVGRELAERKQRSVIVVSASRLEGKTTTSCNLALALASMGGDRRIALVDLDLRRPSVARAFGVRPARGVDDVLRGTATLAEARVATDLASLDLYPVAQPMSEPHEHLASRRLQAMMREIHGEYDTIVFDSAPLLIVPDAELIIPHVDGCIAVLRAGQTRRDSFKKLLATLPEDRLIGSFLNDVRASRHTRSYGYYEDADAGERT